MYLRFETNLSRFRKTKGQVPCLGLWQKWVAQGSPKPCSGVVVVRQVLGKILHTFFKKRKKKKKGKKKSLFPLPQQLYRLAVSIMLLSSPPHLKAERWPLYSFDRTKIKRTEGGVAGLLLSEPGLFGSSSV